MKSIFGSFCRLIASGALIVPFAAHAAEPVSAMKPQSVVTALQALGHDAQLVADSSGDPLVKADIGGWTTQVVFYDCNAITHEGCQSLQFNASFVPDRPFDAQKAIAFVKDNRFGAVSVGEDKSINMTWDVVTGSGIDSSVFALVVKSFGMALDTIGDEAFTPGRAPQLASAAAR
ncbi:YbjN domain-containing protein [Novosphingobium sp. KCTC 2891]|uniref:YbjN domain-containing protein n=1 Tax=Novosphingobium sp. KCTC 2891 TaxID=2989730 RepID=UPI0022221207|nr:YbjN domain-containing protein [Novosphingobium sp. KCTC 2891]MCW1382833.1 YbjN domain-containing protein [Novosphingobium sp. KCTC 2891]